MIINNSSSTTGNNNELLERTDIINGKDNISLKDTTGTNV